MTQNAACSFIIVVENCDYLLSVSSSHAHHTSLQGTDVICTCMFSINQITESKDITSYQIELSLLSKICCSGLTGTCCGAVCFHPSVNSQANISTQVVYQHTILGFQYLSARFQIKMMELYDMQHLKMSLQSVRARSSRA